MVMALGSVRSVREPTDLPMTIPALPAMTSEVSARAKPTAKAAQDRRDRAVVLLLATAAVLAAIIATRASFLASEAAGHWQQAVRSEIKRAAATCDWPTTVPASRTSWPSTQDPSRPLATEPVTRL